MMTAADLEKMPQYQKDAISSWVLEMVRENRSRPGVQEDYQKWLAERKARIANTKERRKTP